LVLISVILDQEPVAYEPRPDVTIVSQAQVVARRNSSILCSLTSGTDRAVPLAP
jgi:hypothetical protein